MSNTYGKTKQSIRDDVTRYISQRLKRDIRYVGFAGPDFGKHINFTEHKLDRIYTKKQIVVLEKQYNIFKKINSLRKNKNITMFNTDLKTYVDILACGNKQLNCCWLDYCGPVSYDKKEDLIALFCNKIMDNNGLLFITLCEQERFKKRKTALASKYKTSLDFITLVAKICKIKLRLIYQNEYRNTDINNRAIPMTVYGFVVNN